MNKNIDYYKTLNVDFEFNFKQLKLNYRNLSKKYHPDVNNGDDTMFKLIAEAYKVLSEDELRSKYDKNSKFGKDYDSFLELLDFEFDNENKTNNKVKNKLDEFKNKEMIHVVVKLDTFKNQLTYDRLILCSYCEGKGQNSIMDVFSKNNPFFQNEEIECNFCDGKGVYNGKECKSCEGNGYVKLGFSSCDHCNGSGLLNKKKTVDIKKKDFNEGKGMIKTYGELF